MPILPIPPVLLISDRHQVPGGTSEALLACLAAAISGGVRWVSLREKDLAPKERRDLATTLKALAAFTGIFLSIHDDLDTAAALDIGLHLPANGDPQAARQRLGPRALIGVSAHDAFSVREAGRRGADYVTLSPIFATPSKPDYGPELGLEILRDIARAAPCPVLALGGIGAGNLAACLDAGASGAAVMGPIMRAADPAAAMRDLLGAGGLR